MRSIARSATAGRRRRSARCATPQLINRIPHDPDNWLFWVTKHGVRMTGMPAWDGIMSDEEIWSVIAFIKNSNTLPPEVAAAWQTLASEPTEIDEHTPEQHHEGTDDHVKK